MLLKIIAPYKYYTTMKTPLHNSPLGSLLFITPNIFIPPENIYFGLGR